MDLSLLLLTLLSRYDAYLSKHYNGNFTTFTPEMIDAAFDNVVTLKYSQHMALEGRGQGIEITPYNAGHMIGGSIWRIKG